MLILSANVSGQIFTTPFRECWHLETTVLKNSQIASDNESIFIPFSEGIIKSIDLSTGKVIWKSELGGEIYGSLLVDQDNIFVTSIRQASTVDIKEGENNKEILSVSSLSISTGIVQWKTDLEISPTAKAYLLNIEGRIHLFTENGEIFVLERENGNLLSKYFLSLQVSLPPILHDEKIYIVDLKGKILEMVLPISGSEAVVSDKITTRELGSIREAPTALFLINKDIYIGDKFGKVYKLNIYNGKVDWAARTGGEITGIAQFKENILISSSDNFVYLLSRANGSRKWKKRFQGKNYGRPLIIGNLAVFSPSSEKTAVLIELSKGKTINQINLAPDANNFFTGEADSFKDMIIFPTLQGFYAYSARECSAKRSDR